MKSNINQPMGAEKDKIISYLEEQLTLKLSALEAMEQPLDPESLKDIRRLEEMMLKREIYDLKRHIQVIKMI